MREGRAKARFIIASTKPTRRINVKVYLLMRECARPGHLGRKGAYATPHPTGYASGSPVPLWAAGTPPGARLLAATTMVTRAGAQHVQNCVPLDVREPSSAPQGHNFVLFAQAQRAFMETQMPLRWLLRLLLLPVLLKAVLLCMHVCERTVAACLLVYVHKLERDGLNSSSPVCQSFVSPASFHAGGCFVCYSRKGVYHGKQSKRMNPLLLLQVVGLSKQRSSVLGSLPHPAASAGLRLVRRKSLLCVHA